MSDDGQKEPQSIADALAQADGAEEQEDATVQISKTELAAIRESANNPALTPEVLREINRRREDSAVEDDDPTQTFDRGSLSSLLEEHSTPTEEFEPLADEALAGAAVEEARQDDGGDEFDDFDLFDEFDEVDSVEGVDDLGEFSDADLHAVVFGDEAPDEPEEQGSPALDASDGMVDEEIDRVDDAKEPLDDGEFDALDEVTDNDLLDLSPPSPVSDQPATEQPAASQPPASQPAANQPATQPPASLDDDELIADFRSPESRMLLIGALVGGVAMIAAGVLRFATSDILEMLHPALAGLLIAVGALLLMGVLISFLQDRSH